MQSVIKVLKLQPQGPKSNSTAVLWSFPNRPSKSVKHISPQAVFTWEDGNQFRFSLQSLLIWINYLEWWDIPMVRIGVTISNWPQIFSLVQYKRARYGQILFWLLVWTIFIHFLCSHYFSEGWLNHQPVWSIGSCISFDMLKSLRRARAFLLSKTKTPKKP